MEKIEFEKYFKCFQDAEGNPCGRGNLDDTFIAAEYAVSSNGTTMEKICTSWMKYIDTCIADKTPDKYIKSMINFINQGAYNNEYGGSLKGKQASFMDQYDLPKKKPVQEISELKAKRLKAVVHLPEGPIDFDPDEEWKEIFLNNKQYYFEQGFVIKHDKEKGTFTKINL